MQTITITGSNLTINGVPVTAPAPPQTGGSAATDWTDLLRNGNGQWKETIPLSGDGSGYVEFSMPTTSDASRQYDGRINAEPALDTPAQSFLYTVSVNGEAWPAQNTPSLSLPVARGSLPLGSRVRLAWQPTGPLQRSAAGNAAMLVEIMLPDRGSSFGW